MVVVACCCCIPYRLALMLAPTFAPCVLTFVPYTLTFGPCACGVSLLSNGANIPLAQVVVVTSCNLRSWCLYIYISGMNAQVQHHIITNILSHSLHWFPMATKDCRDSGQLHALIVSLHNWCAFRWEHICPSLTTGGTLGVIVPHCGQLHALIVSLHKDHCMHSTDVLNIFGYFHLIGQKYHKVSTRSIQQYK